MTNDPTMVPWVPREVVIDGIEEMLRTAEDHPDVLCSYRDQYLYNARNETAWAVFKAINNYHFNNRRRL
jgi:hypothetical protein